MSINKVYDDRPNSIELKELETSWDYANNTYVDGIPEAFPHEHAASLSNGRQFTKKS
jgi:hypothetical protein